MDCQYAGDINTHFFQYAVVRFIFFNKGTCGSYASCSGIGMFGYRVNLKERNDVWNGYGQS